MPKKGSSKVAQDKADASSKPKAAGQGVTGYMFGTVKERAAMQNQDHKGWNYGVVFAFAALVAAPFFIPEYRAMVRDGMREIESAKFLYGWFSLLDFAGSAMVCFSYRTATQKAIADGDEALCRKHSSPLAHYVYGIFTCLFSQFGGTTSTAIFLGQNASWTAGNHVTNAFLLAWWLTFCCPMDLWFTAMQYRAMRLPVQAVACVSAAHAVTSWGLEKALSAEHQRMRNSAWGALACGYLSGCFGWPLVAFFETGGDRLTRLGPSWAMQRTFYAVLFYYVWTNPHSTLTPIKASVGLGDGDKILAQAVLAAAFLTLQVGIDIAGVDLLKVLNTGTALVVALVAPINMPLARPKQE
mmetsp:Transcript_3121/g.7532  ORF Transcript_3121/g.7532 Transcript_3121/m.7532 type:complete len:355 (-) Transcript_3121:133-1197(-)